jgi:hypothetical protein
VPEAEESPLLEAVVRKCLVKTVEAGEYLIVHASCVYKCSINRVTNPNPVYSHTYTRERIIFVPDFVSTTNMYAYTCTYRPSDIYTQL